MTQGTERSHLFCSPPSHPCLCPLLKFNGHCVRPIGLSHHLMEGEGKRTQWRRSVSRKKRRSSSSKQPRRTGVDNHRDPSDFRTDELREKRKGVRRRHCPFFMFSWARDFRPVAPRSCLAGSGAAPSTAPDLMARAATTSDSFNAVAEPRRRAILTYLALQERAVGDIVVGLKMEQPSVSKHLRVLRSVGLVRVRRNGTRMFYRTNAEAIRPLHEWTKAFEALWQRQLIRGKERAGCLEKDKNVSTGSKATAFITRERSGPESAEQRLKELAINLPSPPEPFGTYVEAVQTGKLLFLTGMLPTEDREAKFIGRVDVELDVETGRKAARLAVLNVLAAARQRLRSLDKVTRIVRLGVSVATSGDVRDQPKIANAASELLQAVFGKEKSPCHLVYGVSSLPLGAPVELEVIFEVG